MTWAAAKELWAVEQTLLRLQRKLATLPGSTQNEISTRGMILSLLENIRQLAQTDKNVSFRDLTDASFTIAIAANSDRRIRAEEILNAVAQLAYALRRREEVLSLSPTTCEQLDTIMMAINPKLAAQAAEERARFLEWLKSHPFN
jgi:hypothetical protein